jgi:hypothetical protein
MTGISAMTSGLDRGFAAMEQAAVRTLEGPSEAGVVGMIEGSTLVDASLAVIKSSDEQLEDLVNLMLG